MTSSVAETLANLCALQSIDDEARGFREERDNFQNKLTRLKELLSLMTRGLEEKRSKLAEATRWYREKESELKGDQAKVNKAKVKLQSVTKNREYMAMQREIEALRKANLSKEEEMLKLMQAMDEFKASITTEEAKIAELRSELDTEEAENSTRLGDLEKKITSISSRKTTIIEALTRQMVERYARIYAAREGIAIVPTSKDGGCSGCNFRITRQQLQRVFRGESLETCPRCDRILYLEPQTEDQESDASAATAP